MADHKRSSTKHQRSTHFGNLERSGLIISSEDRHKFENRSDRDDSYDYSHGFRIAREERAPQQAYPQSDRRQHCHYDNHRYSESEDRLSGSVMKDHHWTSHDRSKTINSRGHGRFNRMDDGFYERDSSNGLRNTDRNTTNERRWIWGQERYDGKDEPEIGHEKRHHWDNENPQKSHDNPKYKEEEEEEERQEAKSPAGYSSSDVTSLMARYKDRGNLDDLDEQTEQYPYTADRRSERHQHSLQHNSSRGRPSSRGSSSHSLSSASDRTDGSRETDTPKEGSSFGRRLSLRDRRRSLSPSESLRRSESRHRGIRSPSKSRSSIKKDSRSSHSHKHSGKRKHRDRSASLDDDRKRRKRKEREREKDKEISREKEKTRKKDEERRSALTGKKIKLKVKKDKGDHERDANRKDLLQFLNSAFE